MVYHISDDQITRKSPLSLKRFNVFKTVDLAIESVFAIAKLDFPAPCNASIASLLPDIFELAKVFHKKQMVM